MSSIALYLGETVKVCFLETLLRDQRDGVVGDLPIAEAELHARRYAEIRTDCAAANGRPSRRWPGRHGRSDQPIPGGAWSVALHDHPDKPDGNIYPSRLNGHTNLAVYDRAVARLKPVRVMKLLNAPCRDAQRLAGGDRRAPIRDWLAPVSCWIEIGTRPRAQSLPSRTVTASSAPSGEGRSSSASGFVR